MFKPEINAFTLASTLAACLLVWYAPGAGGWTQVGVGLVLTIVVFAFDRSGYRGMWQSIAFACVTGFCLLVAGLGGLALAKISLAERWIPLAWLGLAIVLVAVDRARMEARAPRRMVPQSVPEPMTAPADAITETAEAPLALRMDETRVEPISSFRTPEPSVPQQTVAMPNPAFAETVVMPKRALTTPAPAPPPPPAPAPQPVVPKVKPIAIPPGAGKPATIYLNILDAGLSCLRAVKAEDLGRGYYRITEPTPADEKWEFSTGQIVRCQKKTLSSGKAMVAVEEAPRA